jgi:hypothetical protein
MVLQALGNPNSFSYDQPPTLASSVCSAIVQRYLDHVLDVALSRNIHIQGAAIEVVSFTIKQGLVPIRFRYATTMACLVRS